MKRSHPGIFRDRFSNVRPPSSMAGDVVILSMASAGDFARASSGSYLNGATSSLVWALPDQRRMEHRGDVSALLLEGRRTNYAKTSEQLMGGAFGGVFNPPSVNDVFAAPDGDLDADMYVNTPGNGIAYQTYPDAATPTGGGSLLTASYSLWGYASGNGPGNQNGYNGLCRRTPNWAIGGMGGSKDVIMNSWARLDWYGSPTGTLALHNTLYTPQTFGTASWWGAQLEFSSTFPTSYYATQAVTGTREADIFSVPPSSIPGAVGSGSFYFDIYPVFGSTDAISGAAMNPSTGRFDLLSFGPSDYLCISGSGFRLSASTGMTAELSSSALTWSRHQRLRVIVSTDQGYLEITGATTGNARYYAPASGAFAFLTSSTLVIGSSSGSNANPYFGRISDLYLTGAALFSLFEGGTFTRSTSGSYLSSAPNAGEGAFISWASINQRRIDNRGDGFGRALLMEGSRTNLNRFNRQLADPAYWNRVGAMATGSFAGVDSELSGTRIIAAVDQYQNQSSVVVSGTGYAFSAYGRSPIGGAIVHRLNSNGVDSIFSGSIPALEIFTRREIYLISSAASMNAYAQEGRSGGGFNSGSRDGIIDLMQLEAGSFPSSPIWTSGAASTRGAELLSYPFGQYPQSFRTDGFRIRFALDCSDTELVNNGSAQYPLSFGAGTHATRIDVNRIIYIDSGGGGVASFSGVLFSRGQELILEYRPISGTVTLLSATAGNGVHTRAAWQFPSTAFNVGSSAGAAGIFGRIASVERLS